MCIFGGQPEPFIPPAAQAPVMPPPPPPPPPPKPPPEVKAPEVEDNSNIDETTGRRRRTGRPSLRIKLDKQKTVGTGGTKKTGLGIPSQ